MVEYVKYSFRLAAALVLFFFALVFFVIMLTGQRVWLLACLSVVMVGAAWAAWPRRPNDWRRDPPSQRQLEYAANLGLVVPPGATKGQVSDMITRVTGR